MSILIRQMQFVAVAALLLLSGCGMVTANLAPGESIKTSPNDSVVLVGVKQSYVVGIHKGTYEGESWRKDYIAAYSSKTGPENGYIAVRLPARTGGDSYGISAVIDGAATFQPCSGMSTLTFEAPGGKAVYVGDVEFDRSGNQLSLRVSSNPERAKSYVRERFPSLADELLVSTPTIKKTVGVSCAPNTITIPVYIGR